MISPKSKQKKMDGGRIDSTGIKVLDLHVTNADIISSTTYGPLSVIRSDPVITIGVFLSPPAKKK